LKIAKLDVDQNAETAQKYNIRSIPCLMLFKDGDIVATQVGALSKSQLSEFLDQNL
jgi:thioredoxin 1